jgi:hypothetical protein
MSDPFPIYQLTEQMKLDEQPPVQRKGFLPKKWYQHPALGVCLFKAAISPRMPIPNVRNDWSEKVVYEISKLLDLPAARYEFALAWDDTRQSFVEGSLSVNYLPTNAESIAGENFLVDVLPDYQADYPASYGVENVLRTLTEQEISCPQNWVGLSGIESAADLFVGYLALDALCSGADRHSSNWELMQVEGRLELSPSFDHGASLGANLSEQTKLQIVENNFMPNSIKSAFWNRSGKINSLEAFNIASNINPQSALTWQQQLAKITPQQIQDIIDCIPEGRITPTSAKFARMLIWHNQERILSLNVGSSQQVTLADLNDWKDDDTRIEQNPETGSLADINNSQNDDTQIDERPTNGTLADLNLSNESDVEKSEDIDNNLGEEDGLSL